MTFAELGLHDTLLKALTFSGYTEPTPVQAQTIPAAIAGRDLLVTSQTGSGKTAAFMLPALHRLAELPRPAQETRRTPNQERQSARSRGARPRFQAAAPKMLVLTPTRELALQVTTAADKYAGQFRHLKAVSILGGMPYPKQMELLSRNPAILVATPGRLIDHMESGKIDFSELQILVLDEADRMLDMGFIDDIEKIIAATPTSRQTMLFSATLDGTVGQMARSVTRDAETIQIAAVHSRHENIEQRMHFVDDLAHKDRLLDHLLRDTSIGQAVVFTATKRDADTLSDRLNLAGFNAAPLHGDMNQGSRNRTLNAMRRGQVQILVATDVAARGIDVPAITHVFNYDLPKFAEDYVHRIGRTGRAGRSGLAISLVNHAEQFNVRKIERFTRQPIPIEIVPGHEPVRRPPSAKPRSAAKPGSKPSSRPNTKTFRNSSEKRTGSGNGKPAHGKATDQKSTGFSHKSRHGDAKPRGTAPSNERRRSYADR